MWDICSPTRGGTCTPCAGKQHLSHQSPGESPRYLSDHNERESEVSNKRKTGQATDTIDGKQHILTELPGQRSSHKRSRKLFRAGTRAGLGLGAFAAGSLGPVPGLGTVALQTHRTRRRSAEGQSAASSADSEKISDQQPDFTS